MARQKHLSFITQSVEATIFIVQVDDTLCIQSILLSQSIALTKSMTTGTVHYLY